MFGYVYPDKPELKIKDFATFKAGYCGVCKAIGSQCGLIPRIAINYDCAFLALALGALDEGEPVFSQEKCIINPVKKMPVARNRYTGFAADVNVLLAYYKALDDRRDKAGFRGTMGKWAFTGAYHKAARRNIEMDGHIRGQLGKLYELEEQNCDSEDAVADAFGQLLSGLVRYIPDPAVFSTSRIRALEWMLYNMGRWIYLIDACADLEKDTRKNEYNPLIARYKGEADLKGQAGEDMRFQLKCCEVEAAKAFELLDARRHNELLENILYLGMHRKMEDVLSGEKECTRR